MHFLLYCKTVTVLSAYYIPSPSSCTVGTTVRTINSYSHRGKKLTKSISTVCHMEVSVLRISQGRGDRRLWCSCLIIGMVKEGQEKVWEGARYFQRKNIPNHAASLEVRHTRRPPCLGGRAQGPVGGDGDREEAITRAPALI